MPIVLMVLSGARSFLSRIPAWCWIALAAVIALWWYGHHQRAAGRAEGIAVERHAWQPVAARLVQQNAAIAALAKAGADARARVQTGLQVAQERERALAPVLDALSAEGRSTPPAVPCVVTPGNVSAADRLL